ncbi:hypothetical protein OSTOST_02009 [Ostertagia ostertagi]
MSRVFDTSYNCTAANNGHDRKSRPRRRGPEFISKHDILLPLPERLPSVQPQILLSCNYLWDFMMLLGKLTLPSGLQLIPTKFGYIVSGRQSLEVNAQVKILVALGAEDEKETWDRTDEFTCSEKSERQQINEKDLQEFRDTFQRRCEGFYVRVPWKSNCATLPDKKNHWSENAP